MNYQQTSATALFDPAQPCPAGLIAWNGSDPARRFGVYRNNVIVSLVDALADTFAVTQELVGVQFFRAMAREFAGTNPPTSPLLAFYGDTFPDFIEHFPPATGLPYLADVARIEHLRVHAYHAADLEPVHAETIAAALAEVADLPHLRLAIHPAVGVHALTVPPHAPLAHGLTCLWCHRCRTLCQTTTLHKVVPQGGGHDAG